MALDEKIYDLRREKLKQIEALGQQSYPTKYEFTHTIPAILAEYSLKSAEELEASRVNVRVAGRIMAIRLWAKPGSHIFSRRDNVCKSTSRSTPLATGDLNSINCLISATTLG